MNRTQTLITAGLIAFIAIAALIFFPPADPSGAATLWNRKWAVIEYEELRLIRREQLFGREEFFVRNGATESLRGGEEIRRAGYNAVNLFHDWEKPEPIGIYPKGEVGSRAEITKSSRSIRFYRNESSIPVEMRIGKRVQGGYFTHFDDPSLEGFYFIMPIHLIQRFEQPPVHFRERRVLEYPAGMRTERIQLEYGEKNERSSIEIVREDTAEVPDGWTFDGVAVLTPQAVALERLFQGLRIEIFRDETSAPGRAEILWSRAGQDAISALIRIGEADIPLRIRVLSVGGKRIGMIMRRAEEGIDFIDPLVADRIIESSRLILNQYGKK
jgi:hypothetical protein